MSKINLKIIPWSLYSWNKSPCRNNFSLLKVQYLVRIKIERANSCVHIGLTKYITFHFIKYSFHRKFLKQIFRFQLVLFFVMYHVLMTSRRRKMDTFLLQITVLLRWTTVLTEVLKDTLANQRLAIPYAIPNFIPHSQQSITGWCPDPVRMHFINSQAIDSRHVLINPAM